MLTCSVMLMRNHTLPTSFAFLASSFSCRWVRFASNNESHQARLADCSTAPAWEYDPMSPDTLGGDTDFAFQQKEKMFYVDHTRFLRDLGKKKKAVFFRPSRFGKTHWLSMMEHYHGILHKNQFESTFRGLDILEDEQRDKSLESSFYVLNVSLPGSFESSNYTEDFHALLNRSIRGFLKSHRRAGLSVGEEEKIIHRNSSVSLLTLNDEVKEVGGRLMILVDEYDRAPLVALSTGKDMHDTDAYDRAVAPLRSFLGTLKNLGSAGNRYFVTGITPVAMAGHSIWNDADDLTHEPQFADMLGLTEAEVRAVLVYVAGIEDEEELQKAVQVAKMCYNGYHFSYSSEDLYNPQLVLYFATKYQTQFKSKILTEATKIQSIRRFSDPFQSLSTAQAKLLSNRPDMARALVVDKNNFISRVDQSLKIGKMTTDPHSYLYYSGVLTLADKNVSALDDSVKLHIPNVVTCQNFAEEYVNLMYGTEGSAQRFVESPTVENLKALCEATQLKVKLDPHRTEADFQAMLMWSLFTTNVIPQAERHPPGQSYEAQDILLRTPKCLLVLELKIMPLRDLTRDPVCWPMNPYQKDYQEACTRSEETLLRLSKEDLHSLPGVKGTYQKAKEQAERYLSRYDSSELPVVVFIVIEVGNRYLVDEVSLL
jgi:Predicted AAA-ATPase